VARLTGARHFKRRFAPDLLVGGFDVVYDCVGSADSLQDALRWVRGGGTVVLVGARRAAMELDMTPLWHQEITLVGATGHGTESWPGSAGVAHWGGDNGGRISTFALAAALIREGRLTPQRLITHRFPLRHIRIAVQTARDRAEHDAIKVLLDIRDVAPMPQEAIPALASQRSGRKQ
jgi:threonine dehydrogenase-like Zn-dependent dehydrogenase